MEIKGKIIAVMPAESGVSQRGNSWKKQTYVLETNEQYKKKIPFEVFGEERINNLGIRLEEEITAHIDIDANEYNGRWYPRISCYRVVREGNHEDIPQEQIADHVSHENHEYNDEKGDMAF